MKVTLYGRCLRCWGRSIWDMRRDWYVCESCGHMVPGQLYCAWKALCSRPTGDVIGPASKVWVFR